MTALDDLARRFSVPGVRWEAGPGGLPFVVVETHRCRARLTPYGAHVCEWAPAGEPSPLFLSPHALFSAGKAIRGGVPICFPWFANHATDPTKPAHGFARTRSWAVESVGRDESDDVVVRMRLVTDDDTLALWNAQFAASFTTSLGASLTMTLHVENRGVGDLVFEAALHTYLSVGDVETVLIHGLERTRFVDKPDGLREKVGGDDPITIRGEVDRVYLDTTAACVVDDPVLRRRIRIEKSGSDATVVWNPGRAKGPAVPDLREAWQQFVCVETANCGPHAVHLEPGARHAMTARIALESDAR